MSNVEINYPNIAAMVFGQPLFATREVVQAVKTVLEPRLLNGSGALGAGASGNGQESLSMVYDEEREASSLQVHGKIAVIQVHGLLVARRGTITAACKELVSYEHIRNQLQAALDNSVVEEIVLDLNSGGGLAVGCKELADFIYWARQHKPITALINFSAYSACYFIAAACSKIICSPTGGVGSIGVIMELYEVSRYEDAVGITYNTFFRGGHKNDGSPHEPITEQTVEFVNGRLDKSYATFTESVAQYRAMDVQKVIDTQARVMDADEALALGFVDEILPAQEAINGIVLKHKEPEPPKLTRSIQAQAAAASRQVHL